MPNTISNIEHLEAAAAAITDLTVQDVALAQLALLGELECLPPWDDRKKVHA